jgi:two-component system copper resistance phosphate regulon response regulator CusR
MSRILIAEDEPRVAAFLDKGLRASGFTTTVAADGDAALEAALSGQFDLLLLDLILPRKHDFTVLSELRDARVTMPVIVLTARCGIDDTLAGLRGGADDYMTKPFRFEELLARVRLRLRGDRVPEVTVLRHGRLELDLRTRRTRVGDRPVELSAREFLLAETFVRNAGQVLSRQQLLSHVWLRPRPRLQRRRRQRLRPAPQARDGRDPDRQGHGLPARGGVARPAQPAPQLVHYSACDLGSARWRGSGRQRRRLHPSSRRNRRPACPSPRCSRCRPRPRSPSASWSPPTWWCSGG